MSTIFDANRHGRIRTMQITCVYWNQLTDYDEMAKIKTE